MEPTIDAPPTIGVVIVDDQAPFRAVARTVVGLAAGFDVVGEAPSGEEAVQLVTGVGADIVLMDINLPGISGIEATRQIIERARDTTVILLSSYDRASLPADALTCGAARYVHKEDFSPMVLREVWAETTGH